ncbi:MAG: VPLPA-CTERM sorting domain-containing protein [Rhodobacteraceae bacterium]|nr:VPLPA-CTERM sorting domain-containing protein [Paracoccaceae bacterium]
MYKKLVAALALTVAGSAVSAATIDFVGFGAGTYGSQIVIDGHTITNTSGGQILVGAGAAGEIDGFCSLTPNVYSCEADTDITFASVVSNLSFDLDGSNPGDMVTISIYGIANALLGSLIFTTPDQHIDLSAYGQITRLFFDDNSSGAGYGYSTFQFDTAQVPLPAGGVLLLTALLGLGAAKRRKS